MSDTERWLAEYRDNHSRTRHRILHWLAVPLVIFGMVGYLWSLPIPGGFLDISPLLNWGITFLMVAEVYYFIISVSLAIGMLPLLIAIAMLIATVYPLVDSPLWFSACIFLIGCVGLYVGKGSARGVRALVRDIQLIMIAPVWLLSRLYRSMGTPF